MKKIVTMIAIIMIISVAASASAVETWYVGAMSGLNLRSKPNTNSSVITVYPRGTELTVIGTDGGEWWEVYDGTRQGWVHSRYMVHNPDETSAPTVAGGTIGDCLGAFWVTGYTPAPEENGGGTVDCFGQPLEPQIGEIVAVDKNVIPLGSKLYIEGIGYRIAHDTGVCGSVIDVLTSNDGESRNITAYRNVYVVE